LLWAGLIAFIVLLWMGSARDDRATKVMRWLLYLALCAGPGHAVIGRPPRLLTDAQMLAGLAGVGLYVGVLALVLRRRRLKREVGVSALHRAVAATIDRADSRRNTGSPSWAPVGRRRQ
jgi:hypothetical protein